MNEASGSGLPTWRDVLQTPHINVDANEQQFITTLV